MIARTISSAIFLIITILFSAAGVDRLQAQTAQADRAETSHIASSLPAILSPQDIELYQQIFALQEAGEIKKAAKRIEGLENKILLGHLLSQKYLHPTAWRSSYTELKDWLNHYSDHPAASRIKWLADKRRPKGAKYPKPPKKGYLNGVGQSRPQSFRALIPQSYKGRASPRQTARIAREIRRYIRRGHPSDQISGIGRDKITKGNNTVFKRLRVIMPAKTSDIRKLFIGFGQMMGLGITDHLQPVFKPPPDQICR